jgi:hypothetical protein
MSENLYQNVQTLLIRPIVSPFVTSIFWTFGVSFSMSKKKILFPNYQYLPRGIRRGNESYFSARQGLSFMDDETCDTINRSPGIIRDNRFDINTVTFGLDSVMNSHSLGYCSVT